MGVLEGLPAMALRGGKTFEIHSGSADDRRGYPNARSASAADNPPQRVGRFHPLRKLTPDMSSGVIPWTLTALNRTQESQAAYQQVGAWFAEAGQASNTKSSAE